MSRRVVAIGGGHGLAVTLRSASQVAEHLTAVVSTADDGGSTGRLRESWDVPALGDARRCLAALAQEPVWTRVVERRFDAGELSGHSVGNLLLLALTEELGQFQAACDALAELLGIDPDAARVVPITDDAVVLHGRRRSGECVVGQVAVAGTPDLDEVWVDPESTVASPLALEAVREANLVLLGPGSLFTSVLAASVVGDLRKALADTHARVVYLANLRADQVEARGYDLASHVAALGRHGIHPHLVVVQEGALPLGSLDVDVLQADVAGANGLVHDPRRLGAVLAGL